MLADYPPNSRNENAAEEIAEEASAGGCNQRKKSQYLRIAPVIK